MENIKQAIERAKASRSSSKPRVTADLRLPQPRLDSGATALNGAGRQIEETELNFAHLRSRRIVSHDGADYLSRPYDMLRTQVLQAMDLDGWKILGVTSPTPGCGKTVTAVNLAFSIARQPDRSVVLVDMDLQKPRIADCLGLATAEGGVLDILQERTTLQSAAINVRVGDQRIVVLPTAATRKSSELMGSGAMRNLLHDIKRHYQSHVIILDLPPILSSDDVISILPQIDCVVLVAAVGLSKTSEVEECNRHLQSSHLVRLVVNKATDTNSNYYYDYQSDRAHLNGRHRRTS
jgi:Mrp family chromosome partitioning ATPase